MTVLPKYILVDNFIMFCCHSTRLYELKQLPVMKEWWMLIRFALAVKGVLIKWREKEIALY